MQVRFLRRKQESVAHILLKRQCLLFETIKKNRSSFLQSKTAVENDMHKKKSDSI